MARSDLNILEVQGPQAGSLLLGWNLAASSRATGLAKVVGVWLKCFLTTKGTDITQRGYGTLFPSLIGSNYTSYDAIRDVTALAVSDATEQVRALQRQAAPAADERLQNVEILRLTTRAGKIDLWIRITNTNGDVATVQVPTGV